MKYWAFLSYSHRDKKWGDWLHRALETYRVPRRLIGRDSRNGAIPPRVFPVFRDREELPVSADLGSNINEALAESRYLIVICSPHSAQSRWVGEEIKAFKRLGREDRILALIIAGEPNASDGKPGLSPAEECFPEALRFRALENGELSPIPSEPIAADAREGRDGKSNALLKLLAGILGVNYDDLKQRDNERRVRRLQIIAAVSLALVSGFAAVSVYALRQKQQAEQQQAIAENERKNAESALAKTRATLSQSDFLQAIRSIADGNTPDALAQLARSLNLNPQNEAALSRLTTLLLYRQFGVPLRMLKQDRPVHLAQLPPDATVSIQAQAFLGSQTGTWIAERPVVAPHPMYRDAPETVTSAEVGPNAERIQIFSDYQIARLWDARTGQAIAEPFKYGERGEGGGLHFRADGKRVVNVGGPVRLWDAETGKPVTDSLHKSEEGGWAGFSPDGSLLATTGGPNLWLWDGQSGVPRSGPLRHDGSVRLASFSPDAGRIACAAGGSVQIWNLQNGTPRGNPLTIETEALSLQFSPDGKLLATTSRDNTARVWDAVSGKAITPAMDQAGQSISSAQFSPDQQRLVVAAGGSARIWNAQNGRGLVGPLNHAAAIDSVRFSPDGGRIISASADKTARLWDSVSGSPLLEPLPHPAGVRLATFSDDGGRAVTVLADATGRIWEIRRGAALATKLKHAGVVISGEFTRDGNGIITVARSADAGVLVQLWDAASGKPRTSSRTFESTDAPSEISPDGSRLVTRPDLEKSARILDLPSGKLVGQPLAHDDFIMSAHFSPDGTRVVTASHDKTARVWNAETGAPVGEPFRHEDKLMWAQFSPDGRRLATSSEGKNLQVWDALTGALISHWEYTTYVRSAAFSQDGLRLVTWTMDDTTARIWDTEQGQSVGAPLQHAGQVAWAQFSTDGTKIVTASEDGTARVWDARTGNPLTEPLMHKNEVLAARFAPSGELIVTVGSDKTVRLWDSETGKPIAESFNFATDVISAQFSPDGKRLIVATSDEYVSVWDIAPAGRVAPGWLMQLAEAISGRHLNEQGVFEPPAADPSDTIKQIAAQLAKAPPEDQWAAWGRWWLADRGARTISPFAMLTIPEYIENRINENSPAALLEVETLAIGNKEMLERVRRARELSTKERPPPAPKP